MEVTNQGVKDYISLVQEELQVLMHNINSNVKKEIDELDKQLTVLQVEFPLKKPLLNLNKHKRELLNNYTNIKKSTENIHKELKSLMMSNSLVNQSTRKQRRSVSRGSVLGTRFGGYNKTKKTKKQTIKGGMFKSFPGVFTRSKSNPAAVGNLPAAVSSSPGAVDNSALISKDNIIISISSGISVKIPNRATPIIFNVGNMIRCKFKPNKENKDLNYYYVVIKKFNDDNGYTPMHMECLPWIVQHNQIKEGRFPSSLNGYLTQIKTLSTPTYSTYDFDIYFSEIEGNNSHRVIDYETLKFIDIDEYADSKNYKLEMGYSVTSASNNEREKSELNAELNNKRGAPELNPDLPTKSE
jgi:hypothetical protein